MTLAYPGKSAHDGNAFQARIFWLKAAWLLKPDSHVARVGFESGPRGFDDVWVEYNPKSSVLDQFGKRIDIERFQCKWHVNLGLFTHVQLTEPGYINAKRYSLLQRARDALAADRGAGRHSLVYLTTNHRIDPSDPLFKLICTSRNTLNLNRLFDGTSDRSAIGKVRKCWRDHLEMGDQQLREFCAHLGFNLINEHLDDLNRCMADRLTHNGLVALEPGSATRYDEIPWKWAGQHRKQFDQSSFRQACAAEGLLATTARAAVPMFGIKSRDRAYDRLDDRCIDTLDLIPHFDDRFIRDPVDWGQALLPKLKHFIGQAVNKTPGHRIRLALETHATLAFAAGSVLNTKVRRVVELEQNSPGPTVWSPDDQPANPAWPGWDFQTCRLRGAGTDIIVAVGLTRPVEPKVRAFATTKLPQAVTLLAATPTGAPGQQSVACGAHAAQLAESLANRIQALRDAAQGPTPHIHLFIAAPNAFTFYLGRQVEVMKPLTLYEFDFQSQRDDSYEPALSLG